MPLHWLRSELCQQRTNAVQETASFHSNKLVLDAQRFLIPTHAYLKQPASFTQYHGG